MKSKRTQRAISLIEEALAELHDFSAMEARNYLQMAVDRLKKSESKRNIVAQQKYYEEAHLNNDKWKNALKEGLKKILAAENLPPEPDAKTESHHQ